MRAAIPGGKTALHYAARDGHLSTVQVLLDAGAVLEDRDPNDITPLLYAVSNDRVEVAKFLIGRGADVNAIDWYGRSPLWSAIDVRNRDTPQPAVGTGTDREGNLALAQLLLAKGADPNTRIREMPVVRTYVMPLGSLSWTDFTGETPFIRASLAGDVTVMRLLMQHGADPKIMTTGGTTALAAAAGVNWVVAQTFDEGPDALLEAVRICLEAGIDVNAANSKGVRAIHGAANRGSDAIVRFLVEHGADIRATDGEGRSPLDWANGVFLATHPAVPRPSTIALLQKLLTAN
jgi:ankyrin repeat protein